MNKNLKIFMTLKKAWMMSAILLILAVGYHKGDRDASKNALTYVMFGVTLFAPIITVIKGKFYLQGDKSLLNEWIKINAILFAMLLGATMWGFMIFNDTSIVVDNTLLIIYSLANLVLVFTSSLLYAMIQVKFNNKYAAINNNQIDNNDEGDDDE